MELFGVEVKWKRKEIYIWINEVFCNEISSLALRSLHFLFAEHFTGNQINYLLFSGVEVKTSLSERKRRGSN